MKKLKTLSHLCDDMWIQILTYLGPKTLCNMIKINKHFKNLFDNNMYLWKFFYQNHWGFIGNDDMKKIEAIIYERGLNWKELFMKRYSIKNNDFTDFLRITLKPKKELLVRHTGWNVNTTKTGSKLTKHNYSYYGPYMLNIYRSYKGKYLRDEERLLNYEELNTPIYNRKRITLKGVFNELLEKTYTFPLHFATKEDIANMIKDFDFIDRNYPSWFGEIDLHHVSFNGMHKLQCEIYKPNWDS